MRIKVAILAASAGLHHPAIVSGAAVTKAVSASRYSELAAANRMLMAC